MLRLRAILRLRHAMLTRVDARQKIRQEGARHDGHRHTRDDYRYRCQYRRIHTTNTEEQVHHEYNKYDHIEYGVLVGSNMRKKVGHIYVIWRHADDADMIRCLISSRFDFSPCHMPCCQPRALPRRYADAMLLYARICQNSFAAAISRLRSVMVVIHAARPGLSRHAH